MTVSVVHRIDVRDNNALVFHKDEPAYIEVSHTRIFDITSGVKIIFSHDGENYEFLLKKENAIELSEAITNSIK